MAHRKQKLELTWVGKDERPRLEPRILLEDSEKSFHALERLSETDIFDNSLIEGDNLLVLKALEQEYAGKVKCIYIDPPYNTGAAFQHYDDGVEHSIWLSLLRARLEVLWNLLSDDGSFWISIDDNEMPYLRVLCDELFGRSAFMAQNVWQKRYSRENRGAIGDVHEYVVTFAKDFGKFRGSRNRLPLTEKQSAIYRNPNNDPRGRWRSIPMTAQGYRPNQMYEIKAPGGKVHTPPDGRCWGMVESEYKRLLSEGRIYFGKDNNSQPNVIRYLSEVPGMVPWTWWPSDEVGHTDEAKKEIGALFSTKDAFATPKPERLIERILTIATNPGDLVLDSFLGSGTTGAVAHKMRRRWIGVEFGEHCSTLCCLRLQKVIKGEDTGGVTNSTGWKGGGGFRYYTLAPSLIKEDKWGNQVINPDFNPEMLAEAVCKLEGFRYEPSRDVYWSHGRSTEKDYIYVTTQTMTRPMLERLSEEVGDERTLLVCCGAFRVKKGAFPNLTLKKIPKAVLHKCEWGKDDYSLRVANLPQAPGKLKQEEFEL